jgi:3-dehydroquinate dehydratase-1
VDVLEVRVDHFVTDLKLLAGAVPKLALPLIVTVRDPREGGAASLSMVERLTLYRQFLPAAAMIDVELRCAGGFQVLLDEAKRAGVHRILSWHDFRSTPAPGHLNARWTAALKFRPEVIKFATTARKPAHLAILVSFMATRPKKPAASVMGMQTYGKVSRLTLAAMGSRLNYGYLGEPQVAGQWPAKVLKQRLAELASA